MVSNPRGLAWRRTPTRARPRPRPPAQAEAAVAPPRDRSPGGQASREGLHAGAAEPVREARHGEGGAGAGARQAAVGQTRGSEEARVAARDRPRDVEPPP